MPLFQDLIHRAKQLNQAPTCPQTLHAQQGRYKIIHQALKIPNLPAPLHYLNFYNLIGQPQAPIFQQSHLHITRPLDVATVLVSTSLHSVGHFHAYDIEQQCHFKDTVFDFETREHLSGQLDHLHLVRQDDELSFDLSIQPLEKGHSMYQLPWSLGQFWSINCQCRGQLQQAGTLYEIDQIGVFEYARSIHFAYLPFAFYTYQLIQLNDHQQIILLQLRNPLNSILYSKCYLKDLKTHDVRVYAHHVEFTTTRLYPIVQTPNHQSMYLPRNFKWSVKTKDIELQIQAEARGDFKFGLGAGFVGSFSYQVDLNGKVFQGEHGYCEYIDCRALKYQEIEETHSINLKTDQSIIITTKNKK